MDRGNVRRKLRLAYIEPKKRVNGIALYALAEAAPALYKTEVEDPPGIDAMAPSDRRSYYQAQNERLRAEATARHLVPTAEVEAERQRLVAAIDRGLLELPAVLADLLDDDCRAYAETLIDGLRARLEMDTTEGL